MVGKRQRNVVFRINRGEMEHELESGRAGEKPRNIRK